MALPRNLTIIIPAYDCLAVQPCTREHERQACIDSSGDHHGRAHAMLMMTRDDEDIEITLMVNTKWDLPETDRRVKSSAGPRGSYVSVHSSFPIYQGQEILAGCCDRWETCYWDHAYTESDEPTLLLVSKGSDAVWKWLNDKHASIMKKRQA